VAGGDGGNDPACHHLPGRRGRGPVRHRAVRIPRRFTGGGGDPGDPVGGGRARAPGPGVVTQNPFDRRRRGRRTSGALDAGRGVGGVGPPPPPDPDGVPLAPEAVGDRSVPLAAEGEQDDRGSPLPPPGAGAGPNPPPEDVLLPPGDDHLGCLPWHGRLRTGVKLENPEGTTNLTSGWKADSATLS